MDLKLTANKTTAYVIVERDGAEDVHEKPSELMKMVYAGKHVDGSLGFTDENGELHFVGPEFVAETVFTDKKAADKAFVPYFEFWKLELAKETYAFMECEFYATTADQAAFEKYIAGVKSKKHLHAMARALGFDGHKLEGSPSACANKIKTMRASMKVEERDAIHVKVAKSLAASEKKYGSAVKEYSLALALAKRAEAKKAKAAAAPKTPKADK